MILTVFRPKRIKNGKARVARSYRGRYRLDEGDKLTDIPLRTTDKRVARERLERIVREKQLEAVDSQNLVRTSPSVSVPDKKIAKLSEMQAADIQHSKNDMFGPVTTSQENANWSGRQDSNLRPRGPKPRALPS